MEFRRMTTKDALLAAVLEEECFPDPYSERSILDTLCSEGAMCFAALTDTGELAAYVIGRLIAPEGEIYRVATAPKYRRRGVAYRLLDYAVKTSRGKGLEVLFLELRESNYAAFALYRSYGFRVSGRRKNYYKDPTEDAILMLLTGRDRMEF